LRRWIRERCHWQNLNDKKDGATGSILRHGRAWIRGKYDESIKGRRKELHLEWSLWTHFWALQLDVGSGDADDGISLWVACGLFSLHVTLEGILSRKFIERQRQKAIDTKWMGYAYMAFPRVTGIRIHSGSIWFEIWNQDAGWDSRQPKWMSFNFNVVDFLFGRTKYASKEIQSTEAEIVLNDGRHPLKVTLTEDSWKRPRLPKAKIVRRAKIESVKGVPVPGKGENSWDCDDDAIFGSTFPSESLEDALSKFRESVLKTRERYGGKNWLPEKDKEAV
jgi:hypothetical protein